ncbi:MAG: DUF2110 family protein [Candidatus Bathyarchaeia archaeon]
MPTVTAASKVHSQNHLRIVEDYLKSSLKGLKIKIENVKAAANNWVQITFSGEDEKAAISYLEKELGLCPTHLEHLKKFSTVRGYITSLSESREEIRLDIGLTCPTTYVKIPLQRLQAQLADGRKITLNKLIKLYGFSEHMPIKLNITSMNENCIEAEITEAQLKMYRKWVKSLLDRLIVLGASQQEINKALKEAKCLTDVIKIEPLGLFEHAVTCKLGTDAVGLIPKIGKNLPNKLLAAFQPKIILEFFGDYPTSPFILP